MSDEDKRFILGLTSYILASNERDNYDKESMSIRDERVVALK